MHVTTESAERLIAALSDAFHATNDLIAFAKGPDSVIPPSAPGSMARLASERPVGVVDEILLEGAAAAEWLADKAHSEAGRLLTEFCNRYVALAPLLKDRVLSHFQAATASPINWGGRRAGSLVAWICWRASQTIALIRSAAGVESLGLVGGSLPPAACGLLVDKWQPIRAALHTVELPDPEEARAALELMEAQVVAYFDYHQPIRGASATKKRSRDKDQVPQTARLPAAMRDIAIGWEHDDRFHLFRKYGENWNHQSLLNSVSGNGALILQQFAEGDCFLAKNAGVKIYRETPSAFDADQIHENRLKPAVCRLDKILRETTGLSTSPKVFSWDSQAQGWTSAVEIGFAVKEGGNRVHFKLRRHLTQDETIDHNLST